MEHWWVQLKVDECKQAEMIRQAERERLFQQCRAGRRPTIVHKLLNRLRGQRLQFRPVKIDVKH